MPEADEAIDSHTHCHPCQYSWSGCPQRLGTSDGLPSTANSSAIYWSLFGGQEYMTCRTWSKALLCKLVLPNASTNGEERSRVCWAWVKCHPASSRQAFSRQLFIHTVWWWPVRLSGVVMADNGWWCWTWWSAFFTFWAVFCICLVVHSCFQSVFLYS